MSGLNLTHLKTYVVTPALAALGAHFNSPAAINLLTGTALVESECVYLHQTGTGPALGLWQMEPATHDDCWTNFLAYQSALKQSLQTIMSPGVQLTQLITNLTYACCMARIKYYRSPLALPSEKDAVGLAGYHKAIYNSALGAADAAANVPLFQMAISA